MHPSIICFLDEFIVRWKFCRTLWDRKVASDTALMIVAGSDTIYSRFILCYNWSYQDALARCAQEALRLFPPVASGISISPLQYQGFYASYQGLRDTAENLTYRFWTNLFHLRTTVTFPTYSIQRYCKRFCTSASRFLKSLSFSGRNFKRPWEFITGRWLPGSKYSPTTLVLSYLLLWSWGLYRKACGTIIWSALMIPRFPTFTIFLN